VTCQIRPGVCTALVGPSGSGKSTLLRLLNRLDDPSSGTVHFRGQPRGTYDVLELRRRVGLVGQQPVLVTDRVLSELQVGRPDLGNGQAADLLDRVGLPRQMLPRTTGGLSGGEAQRVCLARALAVGLENSSRLVGHSTPTVTAKVYRMELRPVLVDGAQVMDQLFKTQG
jgi:putative ABC transport system ATP-binding protein